MHTTTSRPWHGLLPAVLLAACGGSGPTGSDDDSSTGDETDGGEPDERAIFADAHPETLRFAIETGLGLRSVEAYLALSQGEFHAEGSADACPTRAYDGNVMTLSASGCTTNDGYAYDGRVVATNAITLRDLIGPPTYDPDQPMQLAFDAYQILAPTGTTRVEGTFDQSSPETVDYEAHSRLTIQTPMGTVTEDIRMDCTQSDTDRECLIRDGDADIEGLGTFEIYAEIEHDSERFTGFVVLAGRDFVCVNLDEIDEEGCHPVTIPDRPTTRFCPSPPPDPEPTLEAELGYGAGCLDGDVLLEGYVDIELDAFTLELWGPRMDGPLPTALAMPMDTGYESWRWTGVADVTGVDWNCDDLADTTFRAIGRKGDAVACQAWGPNAYAYPSSCN